MEKKKREKRDCYVLLFENEYFEEGKKQYLNEYFKEYGPDLPKHGAYFPNCYLDIEEIYYDEGKIHVSGNILPMQKKTGQSSTELGYISFDLPIEMELAIKVIEHYQKQINKLKTILEASKEVD